MDNQALEVFFWIVVCIAVYAVIVRGAFKATEPLRDQLIDLAAEISCDPKTPEVVKARLGKALDDVYSAWSAWKLMLVVIGIILTVPFHRFHFVNGPDDDLPLPVQKKLRGFQTRWVITTVANSPLAAIIFTIVILITVASVASFSVISRMLMDRYDYHGNHARA